MLIEPLLSQVVFTVESGLLLLAVAILLGPALAERLRIPGLVGLIFIGMVFGPFVLNWMVAGGLVATVGAAGLLYLMFLAGIELDLATFADNRRAAVTFGLLTFAIPFTISFVVGIQYLDMSLIGAALVGAMWASHTIVAYPEVKTAGLDTNRAVGSAVASTVITDVLALIILAVAASSTSLQAEPTTRAGGHEDALLPLPLGLIVLAFFTLWLLPRIARWAFTHFGRSRTQRFIIALGAMAAGGVVSLLGGIEGLVGAFLAGIGLNRLVPGRGALMERIEFFGAALFVPAFLISVGLSVDPLALIQGETIRLAVIFSILVVVGKGLAAFSSGRLFGFSNGEIGVMASLTIGQAAATLAIAQVGVSSGVFGQDILNAAVLTVVITVLITSFGTRYFAKRVEAPEVGHGPVGSHVLVDASISSPPLARLASAIATPDGGLVSPFVVTGSKPSDDHRHRLEESVDDITALGHDSEGIVRVGALLSEEIRDLAVESKASLVLVPWPGIESPGLLTIRDEIEEIGLGCPVPLGAAALRSSNWERIVVVTGHYRSSHSDHQDTLLAIELGRRLSKSREQPTLHLFVSDPLAGAEVEIEGAQIAREDLASLLDGDALTPSDLVISPAHVVQGLGLNDLRRARTALAAASFLVVAGPHRLTLRRAQPTRPALGLSTERGTRSFDTG